MYVFDLDLELAITTGGYIGRRLIIISKQLMRLERIVFSLQFYGRGRAIHV